MKNLTSVTLTTLSLLLCACAARAQATAAAPWVNVSPEGESFVIKMPRQPASYDTQMRAGGVIVSGRRYEAAGDDANTYAVWSLTTTTDAGQRLLPENYRSEGVPPGQAYLDVAADFAWVLLVKSEFEDAVRLKEKPLPALSLAGIFELGGRPAREYTLSLKKSGGPVYISVDGPRTYIIAASGPDPQSPSLKKFVESFTMPRLLPPAIIEVDPALIHDGSAGRGSNNGDPKNNAGGGDAPVDYSKTFRQAEVTKKALITAKPEPKFTEDARRYNVTGVVRIRAILAATGEVTSLSVAKWLPHGLTHQALDAARGIRFEPAQKDGHVVSQYVTLEYNFNIY